MMVPFHKVHETTPNKLVCYYHRIYHWLLSTVQFGLCLALGNSVDFKEKEYSGPVTKILLSIYSQLNKWKK